MSKALLYYIMGFTYLCCQCLCRPISAYNMIRRLKKINDTGYKTPDPWAGGLDLYD